MTKLIIHYNDQSFEIRELPSRAIMAAGSCVLVAYKGKTLIEHDGVLYSSSLRGKGCGIGKWFNVDRHWIVLLQMICKLPKGVLKHYDVIEKERDKNNKTARAAREIESACKALGIKVPAAVQKINKQERKQYTEWMP